VCLQVINEGAQLRQHLVTIRIIQEYPGRQRRKTPENLAQHTRLASRDHDGFGRLCETNPVDGGIEQC
jgi:hypothetical protein